MLMSTLDDLMRDSYNSLEQEERKAQQVEEKIKAIPGASSLLPARQYGKPVPVDKFGITLKSLIERNDKYLASFLGIATGFHQRLEEKERLIEAIMSEAGEHICNLANDEGIETNHYKWGTQAK